MSLSLYNLGNGGLITNFLNFQLFQKHEFTTYILISVSVFEKVETKLTLSRIRWIMQGKQKSVVNNQTRNKIVASAIILNLIGRQYNLRIAICTP